MWRVQNFTPPPSPTLRTRRASDCKIAYNTCSVRVPINQNPVQGHLWSYSMEALSKESKFAVPVLTWAQRRSDLREKSMVGKFVRSSLQGLNHEDVLLRKWLLYGVGKLEQSLVLLFEDGYICTHYNTVNYNWPRQMTRVWILLILNIRLHVFKRDLISYILERLNNATPRHVFLAFQTKTRFFGNRILETEINFLNVCKTATQVLKQQFLKVYPPYFYCILKNTPTFSLILKILPPHSKHRPPLSINNEQSLTHSLLSAQCKSEARFLAAGGF